MAKAPETVLVLLKASVEVITQRGRENPHKRGVVQEKDIAYILQRFEEEYQSSLIRKRFMLDTTTATVEETLKEFVVQIEPHLMSADHLRLLNHRSWPQL